MTLERPAARPTRTEQPVHGRRNTTSGSNTESHLFRRIRPSRSAANSLADWSGAEGKPREPTQTPNLDQDTMDRADSAKAGWIDPVRGRKGEVRQIVGILRRRRQNKPILTGETLDRPRRSQRFEVMPRCPLEAVGPVALAEVSLTGLSFERVRSRKRHCASEIDPARL